MPEDDEGSKKAEAAGKPREESSISMSTLGQLEEEEEARQQQQLEQEQSSAAQRHRTELNLQQRPAQQSKRRELLSFSSRER